MKKIINIEDYKHTDIDIIVYLLIILADTGRLTEKNLDLLESAIIYLRGEL